MNSKVALTHPSETNERGSAALTVFICFLLAHHLAVFAHEYAHSFLAFALGLKANPLQIDFGGAGLVNLLLLSGIDEHVDYQSMIAHGAGWAMALVALAGPGFGNGFTYLASLTMMNSKWRGHNDRLFLFAFALNVTSVGNFFSYVPIRTFATHGDIAHITQGLGVSPWLPLIVLGIPTLGAVWWLFWRTMPIVITQLAPGQVRHQRMLVTLTTAVIFGFFGLAGWSGYGTTSHVLSCVSIAIAPLVAFFTWPRTGVSRGDSGDGDMNT